MNTVKRNLQALELSEPAASDPSRPSMSPPFIVENVREVPEDLIEEELATEFSRPPRSKMSLLDRLSGTQLFDALPRHDLGRPAKGEFDWESHGSDPWFELIPFTGKFPSGWVEIQLTLEAEAGLVLRPALHVDHGYGYRGHIVVRMPASENGNLRAMIWLPRPVRGLRFDPLERPGLFSLSSIRIRQLSSVEAGIRLVLPSAKDLACHPKTVPQLAFEAYDTFKERGVGGLKQALADRYESTFRTPGYPDWLQSFDTLLESDRDAIRARIQVLKQQPLCSLLLPLRDCTEPLLRRALERLSNQLYPHWELLVTGDLSSKLELGALVEEFSKRDSRIQALFSADHSQLTASLNAGLKRSKGQFIFVVKEADLLSEHALYMMVEELNATPEAAIIYSDEDCIDSTGRRSAPHFKPDWNQDLFFSHAYAGPAMIESALARKVGGFRSSQGDEELDLVMRCVTSLAPARIRHIPYVLYHRASEGKGMAISRGYSDLLRERLLGHLSQKHPGVKVDAGKGEGSCRVRYPLPKDPPLVSLLIPTRDCFALLKQCVESIISKTDYPNYEIVIVDNLSSDSELLHYFRQLETGRRAKVIQYSKPFNYSAINNLAARNAKGDLFALLNNDLEVISPDWLSEMVSQALRPEIGAVGALLYYPDDSVQHAGVVLGMDGMASHIHRRLRRGEAGYAGRALATQEVSAITGACLVVRKELYERVGGLDEELAVAFNDIDFCLRLRKLGYHNLFTPYSELYHHESATRGLDDTPRKRARLAEEVNFMVDRWGAELREDPFFQSESHRARARVWPCFPPARALAVASLGAQMTDPLVTAMKRRVRKYLNAESLKHFAMNSVLQPLRAKILSGPVLQRARANLLPVLTPYLPGLSGKMRVALLTVRLQKGYGVDIVVAEQIEYLVLRGYQVTVMVLQKDDYYDERFSTLLQSGALNIQVVPSLARARAMLSLRRIQLVIVHTPPFYEILNDLPREVFKVFVDHGEPPAALFPDREERERLRKAKIQQATSADLVISISKFIQKDSALRGAQAWWEGNDHLLQRRSNLGRLAGDFRSRAALKDEFLVLNVTRYFGPERAYKGIDLFVAVKNALYSAHPELENKVKFVLAGRSNADDREWAYSQGMLAFSNFSEDALVSAYLDANFYLSTSKWEGYNLGLAQALAFGLNAAASEAGAHSEFEIPVSNDPKKLAAIVYQAWQATQKTHMEGRDAPWVQRMKSRKLFPWKDAMTKFEEMILAAMEQRAGDEARLDQVKGLHAANVSISARTFSPEVSFLILTKNRPDLLIPCVRSIEKNCDIPFEIIIGDTGSTDEAVLRFYQNTRHQVLHLGFYNFSAGNNILAGHARAKYLVLMNNDVELIATSFKSAVEYMEGNPRVGTLGAYLLFRDGKIQHAGVKICTQAPYRGIPEHFDKMRPIEGYGGLQAPREVVCVTGALLMIRADEYQRLGGLDEIFREEAQDADLCLKLLKEGRRNVVHPSLMAYHYENATRTVKESPHDRDVLNARYADFIEKEVYRWQADRGL